MTSQTHFSKSRHTIQPRDLRFGRGLKQDRWWMNGDPIATAFYNSLSVSFPRGEAYFVESVKNFRDIAPPKLQEEINAFIKQEVNHSREHVAFNNRALNAGYDLTRIEADVIRTIEQTTERPPIAALIATMALEHFTAILAHQLLTNPAYLAGADKADRDLWRWHALEEIEHKAVAYDTWLNASRDWPSFKRWKIRCMLMLLATRNFFGVQRAGMLDLLKQDGLTGPRIWLRLTWYLFGNPGMVRKIIPSWLAYFLPGFHPWKHDDSRLIKRFAPDFPVAKPTKPATI